MRKEYCNMNSEDQIFVEIEQVGENIIEIEPLNYMKKDSPLVYTVLEFKEKQGDKLKFFVYEMFDTIEEARECAKDIPAHRRKLKEERRNKKKEKRAINRRI
jgi:hypothetical protein